MIRQQEEIPISKAHSESEQYENRAEGYQYDDWYLQGIGTAVQWEIWGGAWDVRHDEDK